VQQLPPFSRRFEDAVGLVSANAAVRRMERVLGLAARSVRAIDLLSETLGGRTEEAGLATDGVSISFIREEAQLPVDSNLESGEAPWFR
jgi:hypothetical protein